MPARPCGCGSAALRRPPPLPLPPARPPPLHHTPAPPACHIARGVLGALQGHRLAVWAPPGASGGLRAGVRQVVLSWRAPSCASQTRGPEAAASARTAPRRPPPSPPPRPGPRRARPPRAPCRRRPCAAPPAAWPRAGRAPRPAARPPPPRSARAGARHVRVGVGRRNAEPRARPRLRAPPPSL